MEGRRAFAGVLVLQAALIAGVLALPSEPASAGEPIVSQRVQIAGEGKQTEDRGTPRDKCKRAAGSRAAPPKGCPDGGERTPNDGKRSPLDDAPPLTPLVA
jgi:hypothetical protein